MGDIFVSYASEDREYAKRIAATLEHRGCSVWWDRAIPIGMTFDEVIERALDETRCVVVLWSGASPARSCRSGTVNLGSSLPSLQRPRRHGRQSSPPRAVLWEAPERDSCWAASPVRSPAHSSTAGGRRTVDRRRNSVLSNSGAS